MSTAKSGTGPARKSYGAARPRRIHVRNLAGAHHAPHLWSRTNSRPCAILIESVWLQLLPLRHHQARKPHQVSS
jgi:hypothetical protein